MHHWTLHVIVFRRDDRFEAEAINAAVAGVGSSAFEALHNLEQMAFSMADAAVKNGAKLTFDAEQEDQTLFRALKDGKIDASERTSRGIVAMGDLGIGLEELDADTRVSLESAKFELVGGPV